MSDHRDAARGINGTINEMMGKPISEIDQILQGAVVWDDADLDEIHADAEAAQSLDPETTDHEDAQTAPDPEPVDPGQNSD